MLSFKNKRINKNDTISIPKCVIYAECVFDECKKFRFTVPKITEEITLKIFSRNCFNEKSHRTQQLCRNLSNLEREIIAKELQNQSADVYRNREVNRIAKNPILADKIKLGDLQSAKPVKTLRKAKSKYAARDDTSSDDFIDLVPLFQNQLIQLLSMPLKIEIYTDDQIEFAYNHKPQTVFFDATGSLMRKCNS